MKESIKKSGIELGIYTLGDLGLYTVTGEKHVRRKNEGNDWAAKLTDETGLDVRIANCKETAK
ncbi:hypothetical protein [Mesobacillus harenae]|uniref:hypothetical protein n=1 Tax=Mesobacillus harenae TaxID=2213203 RepID=UPI001580F18F|nr:hypothetical protein [Mesobacillus harenae]